ncbi:MAG TPA: cysteine-rich CWC family protein [Ramlibacter sp.]|nr:cysteine-rich CWC family protein [Ramlibacter sp.]
MPDAAPRPADPANCPLCGAANGCAMERQRLTGEPQPPCWCTQVDFSRELLSRLPDDARGKACICPACAAPIPG